MDPWILPSATQGSCAECGPALDYASLQSELRNQGLRASSLAMRRLPDPTSPCDTRPTGPGRAVDDRHPAVLLRNGGLDPRAVACARHLGDPRAAQRDR